MGAAAKDRGHFAAGEIWSTPRGRRPRLAGGHDGRCTVPRSFAAIQLRRRAAPDARLVSRPTEEIALGLMVTLAHLGRIGPGTHRIETPVGVVSAQLEESGDVVVRNIASYRLLKDVTVGVDGFGHVTGDVAWGGNWFFLLQGSAVPI